VTTDICMPEGSSAGERPPNGSAGVEWAPVNSNPTKRYLNIFPQSDRSFYFVAQKCKKPVFVGIVQIGSDTLTVVSASGEQRVLQLADFDQININTHAIDKKGRPSVLEIFRHVKAHGVAWTPRRAGWVTEELCSTEC
jgi:hypothetical protein